MSSRNVDLDKFRLRRFVERLVDMGEVEIHAEPVPLTGLGAFAVESHLAGAQKLFECAVRECGEVAAEPAVEARAVIVALDGHVRCAARRRCSD